MNIGTLKEIKNNENRVGLTPEGVKILKIGGHIIFFEHNAGKEAGYSDEDYISCGAKILPKEDIWKMSDIIVKVKEPLKEEYPFLKLMKGKTLYTYLHLAAADKELTRHLLENRITGIAYETVTDDVGRLPLLAPMSEVAGVLAVQYGAEYLQKKYNGKGITLGTITGTPSAHVVVVGGGTSGAHAARTSAGMGSIVTLLELNDKKIAELKERFKEYKNMEILKSTPENVKNAAKTADLLVGAVLVPGNKAPVVVTEEMVRAMQKGTVMVDIAIDQGGCIWGSKTTSHDHPIFDIDGKIYCCIPNMPGQVAFQSTKALTSATIKHLENMAKKGVIECIKSNKNLRNGVNTIAGKLTNEPVAKALGLQYTPIEKAMN